MTAALLGFLLGIPVGAVALAVAQALIVGRGQPLEPGRVFLLKERWGGKAWAGSGYGPIRPSCAHPPPPTAPPSCSAPPPPPAGSPWPGCRGIGMDGANFFKFRNPRRPTR